MHKLVYKVIFIIFFVLILSCKSNNNNEEEIITFNGDSKNQKSLINEESINEIIGSFPSPIEMAAVLKSINQPFNKRYLVDPEKTLNYDLNVKKAFALGVLSADLGYLNVYEKTNLIVEYLSAIKKLSDELRVSQFFDFQTLKRLATSNENIDSLQFLSVQSFRDMDEHLRNTGKSNLSLLMVTGVYVESLYLLTQVTIASPTEQLKQKIAEQKFLLDLLYPVVKLYSVDDPYFKEVYKNLGDLYTLYQKVEVQEVKGQTKTKVVEGRVVVSQEDVNIVKASDEVIDGIIQTTTKIRTNLLNL